MLKFKKITGLEKRWLLNNVSIMIALVAACILTVTVSQAAYYYSNMRSGLESKARTTALHRARRADGNARPAGQAGGA